MKPPPEPTPANASEGSEYPSMFTPDSARYAGRYYYQCKK